jgi:hypothetical protein
MSRRRTRLAARVFRGESVAFEACAGFRVGIAEHVCHCGWLVDDHHYAARARGRSAAGAVGSSGTVAWRAPLAGPLARRLS